MEIGIIFDWDGVIIDSSAAHERSWERLAEEENLPLPAGHFEKGFGKRNQTIIPDILGWSNDPDEIQRLGDRKEVLYRESLVETGIGPLPGVEVFLQRLQQAGIPMAVGSSTPRANIDAIFAQTQLRSYFSAVVCGDDVTHGKPNPEVFLKAAQGIGLPPERCIVFEDAPFGIDAAHAGKMVAIGVAFTGQARNVQHAERVVQRLDELTVDDLHALLTHHRPARP